MFSFQGGYHSKTRSLIIMKIYLRLEATHAYLDSFSSFYPLCYKWSQVLPFLSSSQNQNKPLTSLTQWTTLFDSTTMDFNSLFTSFNSFSFPSPPSLWFFFFYKGEGSSLHNLELHTFLFVPRVFFSIYTLLLISLIFLTPQTQDIEIWNTQPLSPSPNAYSLC